MTRVRAKRLGWNETTNVTATDELDPYDYASDVVTGELQKIQVNSGILQYTNYVVNGQPVDPDTVEELGQTAAAVTDAFYRKDQRRDKKGRWTKDGTIDGAKKVMDHTRDHGDELEGKEKDALISYGSEGYTKINGGLRKSKGNITKLPKKAREETEQLDNVFKNLKPLTQHIGVHRGMNNADKILGTTDPEKLKGMTLTDHGFMSTTPDEDVTRSFAFAGVPATFNITVPAGKKALNVEKALGEKDTFEPEVLLPRGTTLRIVNVRKTGSAILENEKLIIDAEVV